MRGKISSTGDIHFNLIGQEVYLFAGIHIFIEKAEIDDEKDSTAEGTLYGNCY